MIQVTSWADRSDYPDLTPGRWVQLGGPTLVNYWLTGLPGGKIVAQKSWPYFRYQKNRSDYSNYITALVEDNSLSWPKSPDGFIKGLFGQRQII